MYLLHTRKIVSNNWMKERHIHTKLVSLYGTRHKVKKTEIQGNHKKKKQFHG